MILQNASKMETLENADDDKMKSQVDSIIDEIANLTIQHFLLNNLDVDELGRNKIRKVARTEFFLVINRLKERFARIDHVEFICKTTIVQLTKHFEAQRLFLNSEDEKVHFETFQHLKDEQSEKKYLSQLSLVLIQYLLPECYSKVKLFNILAEDILTNCLLYPLIDNLADPDFINTTYLTVAKKLNKDQVSKESPGELRQSLWSKINSFSIKEDEGHEQVDTIDLSLDNILMLVNLADTASDEETLKQVLKLLRQNIDVIANLRDVGDKKFDPELLHWTGIMAELTKAKTNCQMKLDDVNFNNEDDLGTEFSLDAVLGSPTRRRYFHDYLEDSESQSLLSLWESVEEMKTSDKAVLHELGTKIFYKYINRPVPTIYLDKNILKKIESFLMGDTGHQVRCRSKVTFKLECIHALRISFSTFLRIIYLFFQVFYEIQFEVAKKLDETCFNEFCQTEIFYKMINETNETCNITETSGQEKLKILDKNSSDETGKNEINPASARRKMELIEEQINNKNQAQEALQKSLRPDSKVLLNISEEIQALEAEKSELNLHIEQTESWAVNLGKWQCRVHEVTSLSSKDTFMMSLVVFIPQERLRDTAGPHSWMVSRSLMEVIMLQRQLQPYFKWVAELELPQPNKESFNKLN